MMLRAIKSTLLIDTSNQKILDVYITATRKRDSQIILPKVEKVREKKHKIKDKRL